MWIFLIEFRSLSWIVAWGPSNGPHWGASNGLHRPDPMRCCSPKNFLSLYRFRWRHEQYKCCCWFCCPQSGWIILSKPLSIQWGFKNIFFPQMKVFHNKFFYLPSIFAFFFLLPLMFPKLPQNVYTTCESRLLKFEFLSIFSFYKTAVRLNKFIHHPLSVCNFFPLCSQPNLCTIPQFFVVSYLKEATNKTVSLEESCDIFLSCFVVFLISPLG